MGTSDGRTVLAAQYFCYFGVMGIYLPYFNLYCHEIGFSGWQIGFLNASRSIAMIVFGLLWSVLADRWRARRPIYILCNIISAALWGLFLVTVRFEPMLSITLLYAVFFSPLIAFLEAFAMDVLGKGKNRYGRMRVWGSMAFVVIVLVLGRAIDLFSVTIIIPLIFALSWVQALISLKSPSPAAFRRHPFADGLRGLFTGRVAVFMFCAFLMLFSHGSYYAFFSIHLSELGYQNSFIGLSWAAAVCSEIVAMLFSERIFKKLAYETVLLISFGAAVLRWLGMSVIDSPAGLLALQVTHAATYGTFHMASILYIDELAPPSAKTVGQAVNNAVTYGLGLMAGFFVSGALYERSGPYTLFALSGLSALAGGLLFLSYTHLRPVRAGMRNF